MLMSRPRSASTHAEVANVHNYYERLVTESILKTDARAISDADFLADVSCVALNHLPPRYIRHDVDMSFFMSPVEREETENKVQTAVDYALVFVREHEDGQQEVTSDDIITDAVDSEAEMESAIAEEENIVEDATVEDGAIDESTVEESTMEENAVEENSSENQSDALPQDTSETATAADNVNASMDLEDTATLAEDIVTNTPEEASPVTDISMPSEADMSLDTVTPTVQVTHPGEQLTP